jgi:hypothetical protein
MQRIQGEFENEKWGGGIMQLQIGHIYIIRGMGEMKLLKQPVKRRIEIFVLEQPSGSKYYAAAEQFVKEATEADIEARKKELISRDLHNEAKLLQVLWAGRSV